MQVSRYSAPRSRANWTSATLDTSTDRFSRKSPGVQQRLQDLAVVLARQRGLDEFHAELLGFGAARVLRGDDGDAIGRSANVTQDQRQDTLSDAAETHKYDLARKFHMHFVVAHNSCPILFPSFD